MFLEGNDLGSFWHMKCEIWGWMGEVVHVRIFGQPGI